MADLAKIRTVYKNWDAMTKIASVFVLLSFISKILIFVMTGKSYMFLRLCCTNRVKDVPPLSPYAPSLQVL